MSELDYEKELRALVETLGVPAADAPRVLDALHAGNFGEARKAMEGAEVKPGRIENILTHYRPASTPGPIARTVSPAKPTPTPKAVATTEPEWVRLVERERDKWGVAPVEQAIPPRAAALAVKGVPVDQIEEHITGMRVFSGPVMSAIAGRSRPVPNVFQSEWTAFIEQVNIDGEANQLCIPFSGGQSFATATVAMLATTPLKTLDLLGSYAHFQRQKGAFVVDPHHVSAQLGIPRGRFMGCVRDISRVTLSADNGLTLHKLLGVSANAGKVLLERPRGTGLRGSPRRLLRGTLSPVLFKDMERFFTRIPASMARDLLRAEPTTYRLVRYCLGRRRLRRGQAFVESIAAVAVRSGAAASLIRRALPGLRAFGITAEAGQTEISFVVNLWALGILDRAPKRRRIAAG